MNNRFDEVHPELIKQWSEKNYPLKPSDVTYGSKKIVWWNGDCGHTWQASIKSRHSGENCPICSGNRVIEGINDLATLRPELVKEWAEENEIKPTQVTVGTNKKVVWKCKYGHKWEAAIKNRTIGKTGCPYCSHNKVLSGFNDLAYLFPNIAQEWNYEKNKPLLPTQVTAYSGKKVWWKCSKCGKEWETHIATRTDGSKCPYCSGFILEKGFNDFQTKYPELSKEWSEKNYPLKPDMINAKSRKNVWWKCSKCNNEWKSVVYSRVKGVSCPVCADREVLSGYNDLKTTDKDKLKYWDYSKNKLYPTKVSRNSLKVVWWTCEFGHSYREKIANKIIDNKPCPTCIKEFSELIIRLSVLYYGNKAKRNILIDSDEAIGLSFETYMPSEKLAIESEPTNDKIKHLKQLISKENDIRYIMIPNKIKNNPEEIPRLIKQAFRKVHIFINSDDREDLKEIVDKYLQWRKRNIERTV